MPADEARSEQVDALFAEFARPNSPGASVTVSVAGRVVHSRGYGLADLERPRAIEPSSVVHAASVAKQFTAFLTLLLEAEGVLSTEDPVTRWLPELRCGADVSVRHLLEHTSGVRDQWQLLGLSGVRVNGDVITQEDVLELLFRQEGLSFAPGAEQSYSNSGYTLLAEIVARASGEDFAAFARRRIFAPLGMTRTSFQVSPRALVRNRALSYAQTADGAFESVPLAFATYGATGLMTTTEDLIRWAENAWELRVGSTELYARMAERGVLTDGSEVNFTNGLQVRTWRGYEVLGHPGADAGYRSAVVWVPELRLAVGLLGNVASVDMWGLPDGVLEIFAPATEAQPIEAIGADTAADEPPSAAAPSAAPVPPAPATELGELIGRYYSRELDTSYDLERRDTGMVARHVRNGALPLQLVGEDCFACERWYLTELAIERDDRGAVVAFTASSSRSRGVRFERLAARRQR